MDFGFSLGGVKVETMILRFTSIVLKFTFLYLLRQNLLLIDKDAGNNSLTKGRKCAE